MKFDELMAMSDVVTEEYLQPESPTHLRGRIAMDSLSAAELDSLPFGVIKLDSEGKILHYNDYESQLAGVEKSKALGKNFFTELAPCTDVKMFHGRFKEGVAKSELYVTFRYHFSFKKNPRDVAVTLFYSKITGSVGVYSSRVKMPNAASAKLHHRHRNHRADLKIANTAPCGSAITDVRPTPSIVIGARYNFAPISLALFAVASTSSTWK